MRTLCFCFAVVMFALAASNGRAQLVVGGPGVDPADFEVTVFATGLNFPVGMVALSDGSVLVTVINGTSFFGSTSGALVRLADSDGDGMAESQSTVFAGVPAGTLTSLRSAGDLVFAAAFGTSIFVFRKGATPAAALTLVGTIDLSYPIPWIHPHSALAVRDTPGRVGSFDLVFQVGSAVNFAATTAMATLTSDIGLSGTLDGDSLYMVTITDAGASVSGSNLTQLARGLRNAAGLAFHPTSGDLYLQDNGIDGLVNRSEPLSADELNLIAFADIGGAVEDFGYPTSYIEYRTEAVVGGTGIAPLVAYTPIPDPATGVESEGPNDIVFAPPGLPSGLNDGLFVGFHGQFASAGVANEENPLVYTDLGSASYFHFVANDLTGIGHLDGLLATGDKLFVADISPGGGFGSADANSGVIYQVRALPPLPVPFLGAWGAALLAGALAAAGVFTRHATRR